ncbi:hypothetical protein GQ457_08G014480 [Hibiscus cannabinus]
MQYYSSFFLLFLHGIRACDCDYDDFFPVTVMEPGSTSVVVPSHGIVHEGSGSTSASSLRSNQGFNLEAITSVAGTGNSVLYEAVSFWAKMNPCNLQRNAAASAYEEIRGLISISDGGPVVCPNPRRNRVLANTPIRPLRLHMSHQAEVNDLKAGAELLDIILKRDMGTEQSAPEVASSPPFFCGSPPSRAANPLVHDARFGAMMQVPSPSSPSSSSARKGGCVRMKFGLNQPTVRVEGFDCLNRDRQNSSIPAMA